MHGLKILWLILTAVDVRLYSNSAFIMMMFWIITVNLLCKLYKFMSITRFVTHDSLAVSDVKLALQDIFEFKVYVMCSEV